MSNKIPDSIRLSIIECFALSRTLVLGNVNYYKLVTLVQSFCNELSDLTVEDKAEFLYRKKKLYVKLRSEYFPISIAKRQFDRTTIKNRLCQVPMEFWGEEWLE